METIAGAAIITVGVVILFLAASIKIVQEYERGVIFRLGRCKGAKGPGLFFVIPVIDKIVRTNLQQMAVPVQPQQVITKDNVSVVVDAVAYFQVINAEASVVKVQSWFTASQLVAQTGDHRTPRARSAALRPRPNQRRAPGNPRPSDRAVGREGGARRNTRCAASGIHAAGHGQAG